MSVLASFLNFGHDHDSFSIVPTSSFDDCLYASTLQRNESLKTVDEVTTRMALLEKEIYSISKKLSNLTKRKQRDPHSSFGCAFSELLDQHLRKSDKLARLASWRSQHVLHSLICETLSSLFLNFVAPRSCDVGENSKPFTLVPNLAAYFAHRLDHPVYRPRKGKQDLVVPFLWTEDLGIFCKRRLLHEEHEGKIVQKTREMGYYRTRDSVYRTDWMDPLQALLFKRKYSELSARGEIGPRFWPWKKIVDRASPSVPFGYEVASMMQTAFFPKESSSSDSPLDPSSFCVGRTDEEPLNEIWAEVARHERNSTSPVCSFVGPRLFFFGPASKGLSPSTTFLPVVMEHAHAVRVYPYTRNPQTLAFYYSCNSAGARDPEGELEPERSEEHPPLPAFETTPVAMAAKFLANRETRVQITLDSHSYSKNLPISAFFRKATDPSNLWQILPPPAEVALQCGNLPPLPRRVVVTDDSQILVVGSTSPSLEERDLDWERQSTVSPLSRTSRPPLVFWDKKTDCLRWSLEDLHFYLLPVNEKNEKLLAEEKARFPEALFHHPQHFNHAKWGNKIHRSTLVELCDPGMLFDLDNGASLSPPKKLTCCMFVSLCLKYIFKHVWTIYQCCAKYGLLETHLYFQYYSSTLDLEFTSPLSGQPFFGICKLEGLFDVSNQAFGDVFCRPFPRKPFDKHCPHGSCKCHSTCSMEVRILDLYTVLELLDSKLKEIMKSEEAFLYFQTNYNAVVS